MRDVDELLSVNEAFYHAFRRRDVAAMERLWAERAPVTCIHPGWRALTGRAEVVESWRAILSNPEAPDIRCRDARAYPNGDLAYVVCYEVIGRSALVATNVFAREDGTWKLVHHQAGPCEPPPGIFRESEPETPSLQ